MLQAKKYLSILLVLLVCVPIADKAWDDYSHLLEDKCGDVSTHFCPAEHHCPVCDYVFSAPSDVPSGAEVEPLQAIIVESTFFSNFFNLPFTQHFFDTAAWPAKLGLA